MVDIHDHMGGGVWLPVTSTGVILMTASLRTLKKETNVILQIIRKLRKGCMR